MHFIGPNTLFAAFAVGAIARNAPTLVAPKLTFLYSMDALLDTPFSLGQVPNGRDRTVYPIVGGTFQGPRMNGK